MNLDILVARTKVDNDLDRVIQYQSMQQTLQRRQAQLIFVQNRKFVRGVSRVYSEIHGGEYILDGLKPDIIEVVLKGNNLLLVMSDPEQLLSVARLAMHFTLTNGYWYLQTVVVYGAQMSRYINKPQRGDCRTKWIPFQELENVKHHALLHLTLLGLTEEQVQYASKTLSQRQLLSIHVLSLKPLSKLDSTIDTQVFRLNPRQFQQFQEQLSLSNQMYMSPSQSKSLYIYFSILHFTRKNLQVVLVANTENIASARTLVKANFMDIEVQEQVKIKELGQRAVVLLGIDKSESLKNYPQQKIVWIKVRSEEEPLLSDQTWTTFGCQTQTQASDLTYRVSNNPYSDGSFFAGLQIRNVQFSVGGSFLRCVLNLEDSLVCQDVMVMHNEYPHSKFTYTLPESPKQIEFIKPKGKLPRHLAIVVTQMTPRSLDKVIAFLKNENCTTVSFRECKELDAQTLLEYFSGCEFLNDLMTHKVASIEFTEKHRFNRFIESYCNQFKK